MTTAYPASVDSFTTKTDGVDQVMAAHVNNLQDSVVAIETELGTDPAGSSADVVTRLDTADTAHTALKTRVDRLFGTNDPPSVYFFTNRTFLENNVASNILGFEDSQTTPYTPAAGPFSLSVPASTVAESATYRNWLLLQNNHATNVVYLQWTSSTAVTNLACIAAFTPFPIASDVLIASWRMWDVQSPGAADEYWEIRWRWMGSTYPQFPFRAGLWYGTGVTFTTTNGTLAGLEGQVLPGMPYSWLALTVAAPAVFAYGSPAEGFISMNPSSGGGGGGYPASIKTTQFRLFPQFNSAYIDQFSYS